jgi:hypothetical protein
MNNRKWFVPIPNRAFAFETTYYLTSEELIVLYNLHYLKLAKDPTTAVTNVNVLNELIVFDINNSSRGKKKIQEILMKLHDKGYIFLSFSDSKLDNNTVIQVFFPDLDSFIYKEPITSGNWTYVGFTEVTEEMYDRANNSQQFKVLIYVEWRSFKNSNEKRNYAISYNEWELVLGVSHQTAVKVIKQCCIDGLIKKHRGQYYINEYGEIRQETNMYETKEDNQEKIIDPMKELHTFMNSEMEREKSAEIRKHNWFNTGDDSWLSVDDFVIYLTTNCSILKKHADKRIKAICGNPSGKEKIDELNQKALQKIAISNQQSNLQLKRDMVIRKEIREGLARESTSTSTFSSRHEADYDLSDLLDDEQTDYDDEFPMFK